MAYSLFFLEPVKAVDAEFYKEHVVSVKNIDSSRYELLGNYPVTKISNKTIDEYNKRTNDSLADKLMLYKLYLEQYIV